MNWIDLVILIILFVFVVHGAVNGAAHRLVFIVSAVLAYRFTNPFGNWLSQNILPMFKISAEQQNVLLPIASFIILLLLFWAIGSFIASFFKSGVLAFFNHILGGLLGFIIAGILISVTLSFCEANVFSPVKKRIDARQQSRFFYPLVKIGDDLLATKFRPDEIKIDIEDINDFSKELRRMKDAH